MLAGPLPRRWSHVRAVAARAEVAAPAVPLSDRGLLVQAAWLHDVGYSPELATAGFHPLDGARWLRRQGYPDRLVCLVAYHSCASVEAEERGLADELQAEFADEESATKDALWFADLTTGPDGQRMDVLDRLAEIRERYGPDHLVTRVWDRAAPMGIAAVRRTEQRISDLGIQPM